MDDSFDLDVLLSQAVENLADLADAADDGDLVEVGRRLDLAEQLVLVGKQIIDICTESLVDRMEDKSVVIAGVGMLTRTAAQSSTWKDGKAGARFRSDVLRAIERRASINRETGEISPAAKAAAAEAMTMVGDYLPAFQSLKGDGEDELDVRVRDYKQVQWTNKIKLDRGVVAISAVGEVSS